MIRRHKITILTEDAAAHCQGHPQAPPDEQRLYKDDQLPDGKTLGECGFTSLTAKPQAPATVGLAFPADDAFEALHIEPFSSPPGLPDVMKPQDSGGSAMNTLCSEGPGPTPLDTYFLNKDLDAEKNEKHYQL
ncbi:elongin-B-like [Mesocricetus auratus]|uniref:Elongin-B-like n=1 Tax=Mesocricetus auratus TaxID=10036 RepID=A0ABM2X1Y4_MESAU|nr:elongin-B-like [Mesocricetus auratus]